MNTAHANKSNSGFQFDWRADLRAARDVEPRQKRGFEIFLGWFERWSISKGLSPEIETAREFWKQEVLGGSKPRQRWQLDQWAEAVRWLQAWLGFCRDHGHTGASTEERVRTAVDQAGGRRGLARRTRQVYAGWAGRFARWAGEQGFVGGRAVIDPAKAREWLGLLVTREQVSFSTQKQALNGLAFFFKEVCDMEEVDLKVKLRKTPKRIPVVMSFAEVDAMLRNLPESCRLAAELQYGSGLRLNELVNLRVKDIDVERGQVTVRGGKGDKGCLSRLLRLPRPAGWRSARLTHACPPAFG